MVTPRYAAGVAPGFCVNARSRGVTGCTHCSQRGDADRLLPGGHWVIFPASSNPSGVWRVILRRAGRAVPLWRA